MELGNETSPSSGDERRHGLPRQLAAACALIALVVVTAAPAALWTLSDAASAIAPTCPRGIEAGPSAWTSPHVAREDEASPLVPFEEERGGLTLHLDTAEDDGGRVTWARIRATDRDARGVERQCGRVTLRDQAVSAQGGATRRLEDGSYGYVDVTYGAGAGTFRFVERPARYFQATRASVGRILPALNAIAALAALSVAFVRVRRVFAYAWRKHRWVEATLCEGGRIEDGHGQTLARVDDARDLAPGAVLLAPRAATTDGAYRDVPVVARRAVTAGGHGAWASMTDRRLHDARVLATICAACTALALLIAWRVR